MEAKEAIEKIRQLIAEGETPEALEELVEYLKSIDSPLYENALLLSGQYKQWQRDNMIGVEQSTQERRRIEAAILNMLDDDGEVIPPAPAVGSRNAGSKVNTLTYILGATVLVLIVVVTWVIMREPADDNTVVSAPISEEPAPGKDVTKIGEAGVPAIDKFGNSYPTLVINDQTWMAQDINLADAECENGAKMKFSDGHEQGPGVEFYDGQPRYAYYDNDKSKGALYNYNAITSCDICPRKYRLPTEEDWLVLIGVLGGADMAGEKLLNSDFNIGLTGRIDSYGSKLRGKLGFWWSSTQDDEDQSKAYAFEISKDGIVKVSPQDIKTGHAVRCIKAE